MRFALTLAAVSVFASVAAAQSPRPVSFCDVAHNPPAYNKQQLQMPVSFSIGFEDFSIYDPSCKSKQGVWVAFGGDVPGLTPSTVNDNNRKSGSILTIDGVQYPLTKDAEFRKLYALLAAKHGAQQMYRPSATVTGVFLAGPQMRKLTDGGTDYAGYGHLGCCSLFIITSVTHVSSTPLASLTLRGTVFAPDGKPAQGIEVLADIQGGYPPYRQSTFTGAQGEFSFDVAGQLLRVNDPRYRPIALAVDTGGPPITLHLEDAGPFDWIVPACAPTTGSGKRVGFRVKFAVPAELKSEHFSYETLRGYEISPRHSGGHNALNVIYIRQENDAASDPEPRSANGTYSVRWIKDSTGSVLGMDMQGTSPDHGPWREANFFASEAVAYDYSQKPPLALFNSTIDSACISPPTN